MTKQRSKKALAAFGMAVSLAAMVPTNQVMASSGVIQTEEDTINPYDYLVNYDEATALEGTAMSVYQYDRDKSIYLTTVYRDGELKTYPCQLIKGIFPSYAIDETRVVSRMYVEISTGICVGSIEACSPSGDYDEFSSNVLFANELGIMKAGEEEVYAELNRYRDELLGTSKTLHP